MNASDKPPGYRLLDAFQSVFQSIKYRHRDSSRGDFVAMHLYEDLFLLGKSQKLSDRVQEKVRVLNVQNRRRGIRARRGDGTFGEIIPGSEAISDPGFLIARGPVATVEIGIEVKILQKAMIKQIDRVIGDLTKQVSHFRKGAGNPICVAIVGINAAERTTSYEGDRAYPTDGKRYVHPIQEAADAESRLNADARPSFDEFLVCRYRALNEKPFPFEWVNERDAVLDYGAALTRICREYERRF